MLFMSLLGLFSVAIAGLSIASVIAFFVFGVAIYICKSLGLYAMSKRRGFNGSWLAWLPFVDQYVIGNLVDPVSIGENKVYNTGIILMVGDVLLAFTDRAAENGNSFASIANLVLMVAMVVFTIITYKRLFSIYAPESSTFYTVLSIILPGPAFSFLVFKLRNRMPIGLTKEGFYYDGYYYQDSRDMYYN